jgi:hypothetical protein
VTGESLSWLLGCLASLAFLLLGAKLGRWWNQRVLAQSARAYQERGQRGEKQAERLLKSLGYRIRGRQVPGNYALEVDGLPERVQLSADLLVERDGTEWVAEVKTGRHAPRVSYAETRRQMLEYQLAFKVPGVLLVDIEEERVREVRFPLAEPSPQRPRFAAFGAWLLLVSLLALTAWALQRAPG